MVVIQDNVMYLMRDVEAAGARLTVRDGRLQAVRWNRLSANLQQRVSSRPYELVAQITGRPEYQLGEWELGVLRRWARVGVLDAIGDRFVGIMGTTIEAGEAGLRASYWLRCYDAGGGPAPERHLRGIYYCALVYWNQRVKRPIP